MSNTMCDTQQYWLPGFGLSRHIVLGQIQYFLGPNASVRPYTFQGREGYLINGMRLTREQIDDLATMSREHERREAARMASRACVDSTSKESAEQYINELIPVHHHAPRRQQNHSVRGRGSR